MLAAFLPRVGHTETYNILRTNCEKLALQNGVMSTLDKVKTRGCGADERRIRNDSFFSCRLASSCCVPFHVAEIMCTVIIIVLRRAS